MGVTLVTGATGLLGRTVARLVDGEVHAFARDQLDVSDQAAVLEAVRAVHPTFVVHCAALTDVDECERDGARSWLVNAEGAGYVAAAAADVGAEIVAVSTDYVFDGEKGLYTESDETNPIQEYGRAKLAGEDRVREANPRHYIVRSAWIYGPGGKNFLSKVPELVRSGGPIKAISDQRGSPTFATDLTEAIIALDGNGAYGTYHVVNSGSCSSAEFTRHALEVLGADVPMEEVSRFDVPRLAPRPGDTSLIGEAWAKAGFAGLRPWEEAAEAFLHSTAAP
jgi:dTDP-4-dehydrorhamnose reductase